MLDNKNNVINWPKELQLSLYTGCNLQCYLCIAGNSVSSNPQSLNISEKVLKEVNKVIPHLRDLVVAGSGEPLLVKNLADQLKDLHALNQNMVLRVITNGLLFNKGLEFAYKILNNIDMLVVSVNGKKHYEEIMFPTKWSKIAEALKNISLVISSDNLPVGLPPP